MTVRIDQPEEKPLVPLAKAWAVRAQLSPARERERVPLACAQGRMLAADRRRGPAALERLCR